ncbi:MAG: Mrp/NBP35 family ATP-binding protein, partial [Sphaerochaetaceae bacterium]|nr:Mrp/NBP35 family ATP-binding protein [Sphaerochaetaceae bacterium]
MADTEKSQEEKICERMDAIGRKILIMSGKGGVGKTTVTVNLANALLAMGKTVGVLDTDIHGPNIAKMFGCEGQILQGDETGEIQPVSPREGLKLVSLSFALSDPDQAVIFRGPMKISVIKQFLADVNWGTLDYLLIDSPPGTGDEQLTVCQSIPALAGCLIVTTPQKVAILDARRSVSFARDLDVEIIGVVENMSCLICPDCGHEIPVFGKDGGKNMCMDMNVPLIASIPMEIGLQQNED